MRLRNGFVELTWKETLIHPVALDTVVPLWKRLLAPLQHWIACTFRGHTSGDPHNLWPSDPIGRSAPPPIPGKAGEWSGE